LLDLNFCHIKIIAVAKKGKVTSPPMPCVKPRCAAIGSIPNNGATKLSMSGRFAERTSAGIA
jgi:hypothetical protein